MKNEKTSARISSIAGKVLRILADRHPSWLVAWKHGDDERSALRKNWVSVGELRSLAASCLTQSADKPKKAAKK